MQAQMKEVERRVKGYWYQDGLGELIAGFVFLAIGGYFALSEYLQDSVWGGVLQASLVLVLLALIFVGRRAINALKSRFVYPRTGFVEYHVDKDQATRRRLFSGAIAAVMAGLFVVMIKVSGTENLIISGTGLLIGLAFIFWRAKFSGLGRFNAMAIISITLGFWLSLQEMATGYALGSYYSLMGLIFLASGSFVFSKYVRDNPVPTDAA